MAFDFNQAQLDYAQILIIGVGNIGINTINQLMANENIKNAEGVNFLSVSAKASDQLLSNSEKHIQLVEQNENWFKGTENAHRENEISHDSVLVQEAINNKDLVMIVSDTGCKLTMSCVLFLVDKLIEKQVFTVCSLATPFSFEGSSRQKTSEAGIKALKEKSCTAIFIDSNEVVEKTMQMSQPASVAHDAIYKHLGMSVKCIVSPIAIPSLVCVDLYDVKTILAKHGYSKFFTGKGFGEKRAEEAVKNALIPLETDKKATGLLISIEGPDNLSGQEVNTIITFCVASMGDENTDIVFGVQFATLFDGSDEEVQVAIIATGIHE